MGKIIDANDAIDEMALEEIEPMLSERIEKWSNELVEKGRKVGLDEGLAKGRDEGRDEGLAAGEMKGKVEGKAEGKAELFLSLFQMKLGHISDESKARIESASDAEILRMSERLFTAQTPADVFAADGGILGTAPGST